jgi:hypothetical protein
LITQILQHGQFHNIGVFFQHFLLGVPMMVDSKGLDHLEYFDFPKEEVGAVEAAKNFRIEV